MSSWEQYWRSGNSDRIFEELRAEYGKAEEPVKVSFRSIIPELNSPERATHLMHPYPGKLIRHIPFFILSCSELVSDYEVVLDPFCGSGTVLVEAAIAGLHAYGADTNPLARRISSAKTRMMDCQVALEFASTIENREKIRFKERDGGVRLDYWFLPRHLDELETIVDAIQGVDQQDLRSFLEVCFSACSRQLSLADPRLSVPVLLRPEKFEVGSRERQHAENRLAWISNANGFRLFGEIVRENVRRIAEMTRMAPLAKPAEVFSDAVGIHHHLGGRVGLVLTSPPYGSAQKYMRASSLALTWLGYLNGKTIREIEESTIGREFARQNQLLVEGLETGVSTADADIGRIHATNPLRAFLYARYLREMEEALGSISRTLRPGGHVVLVLGDNGFSGHRVPTHKHVDEIASKMGLRRKLVVVDEIRSRALLTKRNSGMQAIMSEYVYVYRSEPNGIGRSGQVPRRTLPSP